MSNNIPADALSRYAALALQIATACVNDCADRASARQRMAENVARVAPRGGRQQGLHPPVQRHRRAARGAAGVFPDRLPHGRVGARVARQGRAGRSTARSTRRSAHIARDMDLYLAGNAYEVDPELPGPLSSSAASSSRPAGEVDPALPPADLAERADALRRLGPLPGGLRPGEGLPGGRHADRTAGRHRLRGDPVPGDRPLPRHARCRGVRPLHERGRQPAA